MDLSLEECGLRRCAINQNLAPGADIFVAYKMASVRSILALRSLGAFY